MLAVPVPYHQQCVSLARSVHQPPSVTAAIMEAQAGEEPSTSGSAPASSDSAPSPQSEAVTNELQELSLQPAPNLLPLRDRKNVLQLKLQQRRTREELVSQGIMPPLKSPAAFHEQRRSLERARTEDYLKRKIRSRPERSELVRMHILEETSAEPSLQAKQLQLKRARLADDLNDKISHRPGPMELIHKNILPVHSSLKQAIIETDFPKVAGEISSFDEDSSDTLSPDQPIGQDSPLGPGPLPSPPDALVCNSTPSPTQFLTQVPPPPPPLPPFYGPCQPLKLSNGTSVLRTAPALIKSQPKPTSERPPQRSKKHKDNKPKVRKLKYHQYIPPDQKADHEPPPQLDSTYAKILHQQQLFLQLQILNQQQQHYNYHTILPAPPKPPTDQPPPTNGPSPSLALPAPSTSSSSQSAPIRQNVTHVGGATPGSLPPNLDDLKVAELKHELKLRSLPVSGTKNDLIERLRNYQAQQNRGGGGGSATTTTAGGATGSGAGAPKTNHPTQQQQKQLLLLQQQQQQLSQHQTQSSVVHQSRDAGVVTLATFPFVATAPQQIMHFGSTSSSPPVSPAPSDRSLAGMSPNETSCNGDSFGEMVSSPLTQLSLHPSPQHLATIKEELSGSAPTACQFSKAALQKRLLMPTAMQVAPPSVNKVLQEKDKQIEELTCMLRQKQRLVETLRFQLEQGKRGGRDAPPEPLGLIRVKEEPPDIPSIPSTFCPIAHSPTPPQCHMEVTKMTIKQEVGDVEEAVEPSLEAPPQQVQVQLEQIQAQQRSQLEQLKLQQTQQINALQLAQQQALQQLLLQQNQQNLQKQRSQQRKKKSHKQQLKQQQQQLLSQHQQQIQSKNQQLLQSKHQHQQILQAQQQQQQLKSQQVSQMFLNQQSGSTTSFPLDLLKTHSTPTLVTDSNGNHFLITLTNHCAESQGSDTPQGTPQGKATNHITLQRLQSTPTKLPSQSPLQLPSSDTQSKPTNQPGHVKLQTRKGQKTGLQVSTNHSPGVTLSFSAPPNLQPFFPNDDSSPSEKDTSPSPSAQTEDLSPGLDHEPLFSPPSPKRTPSPNPPDDKDNGSTQHMDDLFDILIQTGEISATFKPAPDPSLLRLRPNTPSPSPSQAPSPLQLQLHFSPPTPPEPETPQPVPGEEEEEELQVPATVDQDVSNTGSGRLEDFLESTTGKPLLGLEPGGPLTLIDDLHSQMLSTPSILDHTSSPMDTYELSGYTANPPGLDFGDHALDSMDWLDITMGGASSEVPGLAPLGPLGPHTPPSVFSADFLDSSDLQLHWDSCL
ncbi:myocardin-related transcription factor A-like isoform X2 [Coregonus clupeaformis]|uniref:myocardin-related transcription factor A-like isoform X2 n=1 Tax=Coregonus clupeaformis TaxID=59861 RepID=UPI001E1C87F1|nr:myocardin-related transcription factor A-like isoform X2 [Coregonus clupeaformis]